MKLFNLPILTLSSFMIIYVVPSMGQTELKLSLKDAISIAQKQSLDYKIAVNISKSSFWNYQAFRSSFLPKLTLNSTLPEYYRSINRITLPNGEYDFVQQNVSNSSLSVDIAQNVGFTGGRISMSTSLDRIDNFGNLNQTAYTAVPLSFNYYQNSIFYNDFKWQKKIQPLRFEESQREYVERLEDISYNTIDRYFDLLQAEVQLKLDQQNLKNIDTLVKITNSRFEIGTVQLNDVLQARVSLLNARKSVSNSLLSLEIAKQGIVRYLNLGNGSDIKLELPTNIINFTVDPGIALENAKANRKSFIEFQRRRLEAEQNVSKTKSETGPILSVRTNIGLTQRGATVARSYSDLLNNQNVIIGLSVPLIDWGVNKSNRKRAEANLELELNNIDQQTLTIEQEIYLQSMKWNMQKEQTEIAKETSELAQRRYDMARQKYSLGTISFTDFNNAQLDKDRAITDYASTLRNYWTLYYLLRRLTLYDFENNKKIEMQDIVN